eukprot:m.1028 g.1028  ORF g.1028 m.1028 type:complete len:74 (-) comp842_c0_seq1:31-252(-)
MLVQTQKTNKQTQKPTTNDETKQQEQHIRNNKPEGRRNIKRRMKAEKTNSPTTQTTRKKYALIWNKPKSSPNK